MFDFKITIWIANLGLKKKNPLNEFWLGNGIEFPTISEAKHTSAILYYRFL